MTARVDYHGVFRIDDVSLNTDPLGLRDIVEAILVALPSATILLAVSPLVHDLGAEPVNERGRIFPKILNAMSDPRVFYRVDQAGVPFVVRAREKTLPPKVQLASHGLLHFDHRLFSRDVQELSILVSCSLVKSRVFVPPFNKYNRDTESVCAEHGIELVKWEDGWRHVGYNSFDLTHGKWYLHAHDATAERVIKWLQL